MGQLAAVQSSLVMLQSLQIATLGVSGLGLGVAVAGFAVVLKRLKGIETQLMKISAKINQVTSDRRGDDILMIFADVGTEVEAVETLNSRANKVSAAEASERALSTSAGRLEVHFRRKSEAMQSGPISIADMEMLWSLAAAIRLCHDVGLRALFTIDELEAVKALAAKRAQRLLDLGQALSPDALARLSAHQAKDAAAFAEVRRTALPKAETLVQGLRDSVASVSAQSELAETLIERHVSGPTYLAEAANETGKPLLFLPT